MRKSPFSTPRGTGNNRSFGWNSAGSPGRGYGRGRNFESLSPNCTQNSSLGSLGDNFIPINLSSTPKNRERSMSGTPWTSPISGNWSSPHNGNWASPGRGNPRNSPSPRYSGFVARGNHRHSPYNTGGNHSFRGNHRSFNKDGKKALDVTAYINLKSFLEDPWAKLLEKSTEDERLDNSMNKSISDTSLDDSLCEATTSMDEENLACADSSSQEANDESLLDEGSQKSIVMSGEENSLDLKSNRDSEDR